MTAVGHQANDNGSNGGPMMAASLAEQVEAGRGMEPIEALGGYVLAVLPCYKETDAELALALR